MIDQIVARLSSLGEADAYFDVPPFVYEVQIPDFTRRQLQSRIGETIRLHTLHHLDGNPAQGGKLTPRLIGFLHSVEREFFDLALAGVPEGWTAYANRAYSDDLAHLEEAFTLAQARAGGDASVLYVVYGGQTAARDLCRERGWLWFAEDSDMIRGKVKADG